MTGSWTRRVGQGLPAFPRLLEHRALLRRQCPSQEQPCAHRSRSHDRPRLQGHMSTRAWPLRLLADGAGQFQPPASLERLANLDGERRPWCDRAEALVGKPGFAEGEVFDEGLLTTDLPLRFIRRHRCQKQCKMSRITYTASIESIPYRSRGRSEHVMGCRIRKSACTEDGPQGAPEGLPPTRSPTRSPTHRPPPLAADSGL